jgi:hypothetical protein
MKKVIAIIFADKIIRNGKTLTCHGLNLKMAFVFVTIL